MGDRRRRRPVTTGRRRLRLPTITITTITTITTGIRPRLRRVTVAHRRLRHRAATDLKTRGRSACFAPDVLDESGRLGQRRAPPEGLNAAGGRAPLAG
jgi:hypothetical protein